MDQYSGEPMVETIEHIEEHDYSCCACKKGFNIGQGVRIDEEHFCRQCIDQEKHYDFYAEAGATIRNILDLTDKIVDL